MPRTITTSKVERITGLSVCLEQNKPGWVAFGSADDGRKLSAGGRTPDEALRRLMRENWRWIQHHVARRQRFRCRRCDRLAPLQFHHIRPRSKGRTDAPDNIEALCPECHQRAHWS